MATINGLDKMSYAELLKLQERIEAAIAEKRVEDAQATKEALRAMAAPTAARAKIQAPTKARLRTAHAERLRSSVLMGPPSQSVAYERHSSPQLEKH